MSSEYLVLSSRILTGSLRTQPYHIRLAWPAILFHADRLAGLVHMTPVDLSTWAGITLNEAAEAIDVLQGPDPWSSNPAEEGRRLVAVPGALHEYRVVTWEDQQHERERHFARLRQQRARSKKKSVTPDRDDVTPDRDATPENGTASRCVTVRHEGTGTGIQKPSAAPAAGKARRRSQRQVDLDEILAAIEAHRPGTEANAVRSAWERLLSTFGAAGLRNAVDSVKDWRTVDDPVALLRTICTRQLDRGRDRGGSPAAQSPRRPYADPAATRAQLEALEAAERGEA